MEQNLSISRLTLEQETLLLQCRERWFSLEHLVAPTEFYDVEGAIKLAYTTLDQLEPQVILHESPYQTIKRLEDLQEQSTIPLMNLGWKLRQQLPRSGQMGVKHPKKIEHSEGSLSTQLRFSLMRRLGERMENAISTSAWFSYTSWFDFCISVLNCSCDLKTWEALQALVKHCSFVFPFQKLCLVSDRPTSFLLDDQKRFHAVGKPAVTYTDGFSLYFYHGVGLPKEYGELSTQEWKTQWVFQESDPRVRRALLNGIGYNRVFEELQVIELDVYGKYSLLKVESDNTNPITLPIFLLKRINSDTKVDITEVPIHSRTVHEAISMAKRYW
jgi:hypothetical protein